MKTGAGNSMQVDLSRPRFARLLKGTGKKSALEDCVPEIRRLLRTTLTLAEIGSRFGVSGNAVRRFVKQRALCDLRARRHFYSLKSSIEKVTEGKRDMTPTQAGIVAAHKTFLRKLAAQARPDTGIECLSVSARVPAEPAPAPGPYDEILRWRERQYLINPITPSEPKRAKRGPKPKTPFKPSGVGSLQIRDIQRAVAEEYDITVTDIISARRMKDIVFPRQIAMYLAKTLTLQSLPVIGRKFGGRDHTTALHAVRKIAALVKTDPELRDRVDRLAQELGGAIT